MERFMVTDKNEFMRNASFFAMHALILKNTNADPVGIAEQARTYAINLWLKMRLEPK